MKNLMVLMTVQNYLTNHIFKRNFSHSLRKLSKKKKNNKNKVLDQWICSCQILFKLLNIERIELNLLLLSK